MIEEKLGKYSIKKLLFVLIVCLYLDMFTTYIGYQKGYAEANIIINAMLDINPIMIIIFPLMVIFVQYIIYKIFIKWQFELKIVYLLYIFSSMLAIVTNIFWILS